MDQVGLSDSTLQSSPLPHPTRKGTISNELGSERDTSESMIGDRIKCITRIRARDVSSKLRRIPVGFYVTVGSEHVTQRTSNTPASVGRDVVEWDDKIVLPLDGLSRISFTVFASFELGPTLGSGEVLRKLETTVGELLDRVKESRVIQFFEPGNKDVISSCSFFEIEIGQRVYHWNEHVPTSNSTVTEEMRRLEKLTDMGHGALIRYRELQEERDLDESIRHFEHAQSLCTLDHPNRATVLFNLATAKLVYCRVNDVSPDLDVPINLYRVALRLRPHGHPDHALTLLSLGIALQARFQRKQDEADEVEGNTLLSQVLDVSQTDSYAYHAAVLALGSAAKFEVIRQTEISQTIQNDIDDDGRTQRLDAALQWMFYPDSSRHALLDHLGILLCIQMSWVGKLDDPDKAISMLELVVPFTSDNHPRNPSWLDDLAKLLSTRYQRLGDIVDLEKSISMSEEAVRLTTDGDPDKYLRLGYLGNSLLTRYYERSEDVDLEKSISMIQEGLQLTPAGHPNKLPQLCTLGYSLMTRYERFGDAPDLEKSISMTEEALHLTPDGHPEKPLRLGYLGHSLLTRYERFGDVADLERSISTTENALQVALDGHPEKPLWLNSLGNSLSTRYECFGDVVDLEKSILMREKALQLTPDGDSDMPTLRSNLACSLWTRYEHFGDVVDLEKSISVTEETLQLTPSDHPDKPLLLNNLGKQLLTRYERFGDVADLEKSMPMTEEALHLTPDGHPAKLLRLGNLTYSLSIRYKRFGDIVDLERSISMTEQALQLTPDGDPMKRLLLGNLGYSLSIRYDRFGDIVDLKKSLSRREEGLQLIPDGHPDKPAWLNNLGKSLLTRYERFRDILDLEKSISMTEEGLRLTQDGDPEKPKLLNNLGKSLFTRYDRFWDVVDLEKSISITQEGLLLTPDDHPEMPLRLHSLGYLLSVRYERFEDIVDLGKSISMRKQAVQRTPDGDQHKRSRQGNLAYSFLTRYERSGDIADLEESIFLTEEGLQLIPDGHPDKPLWLNNLCYSSLVRYTRFEDVVDLEKSKSTIEEALQLTPDCHPDKSVYSKLLGLSLLTRYDRFGDVIDLEKSISVFEEVVELTTDDDPGRPNRLDLLSRSLLRRFQRSRDFSSSDLSRAILYSSQAARSHTGPTSVRFRASQRCIQCIRHLQHHDPRSLIDAYTVAVDLLPQLAWIGLSLHDRYHRLLQAADAVCAAAAAALDAHLPELAVEWLEQGRSVIWSQLSQLRTPVDDLRALHPDLAVQFEHVSYELEHAGARGTYAISEFANHSDMMIEKHPRQYHALVLTRERLLAEIRALPGFERFLLPKTIDQLSSLAHSGPVVFLNASRHRCDALVVMAGPGRVVHVPLSKTSYDEVAVMQLRLNKLLRLNGRVILRDGLDRGAKIQGMSPSEVFGHILPYLWDKVVSPILDVLPLSSSSSKRSRIFWCPTGPFTFLPIHAAGHYGANNEDCKLSDFVISSYIPTMSALQLPPQEDMGAPSSSRSNIRLLAVRQPSTDGQVHLNGVSKEMEVIRELTSSSPFVDLQETHGTVEDVLAKMTAADWVHFACHGTQDRTNPLDSGLLLAHCKRLKLSDIVQLSRPHRGLAFLSACQTATGDKQLSEEAIHIAAGMLLAGYRGVIATMWSIMDSDAPRVTEDVYKSLFQDGKVPDSGQAAEALHHAVERLRESGAPFLSWVPFIHVGL